MFIKYVKNVDGNVSPREDQLIMRLTGCTLDQLLAGRDAAWWHQTWHDWKNQGKMMGK